jgi:hypothetical protein
VLHSVEDLVDAIEEYLRVHNNDPKPFVWTAIAEQILEKIRRGRVTLQQLSSQNWDTTLGSHGRVISRVTQRPDGRSVTRLLLF